MNLIERFYQSFVDNTTRRAFKEKDAVYTYAQFLRLVNGKRGLLEKNVSGCGNNIGVVVYGDVETYASIFAVWFSGNCFVPVNPGHPKGRNMQIVEKTGIRHILSSRPEASEILDCGEVALHVSRGVESPFSQPPAETNEGRLMYILTTSGSSGEPKQVPITLQNLTAYCNGFLSLYPEINPDDCFLQTYDLTSDAAFTSYLIPLLSGASVSVPDDGPFRFLSIARQISDKDLTFVKMTPSAMMYLKPYLPSIEISHLKHLHFGGEALPLTLVEEIAEKVPSAEISNSYGPTETTVTSAIYKIKPGEKIRSSDGIVSIGKPFPGVACKVVDQEGNEVAEGQNGELCMAGSQVMRGYLNPTGDPFIRFGDGEYYRTGDLVFSDRDGYFYYLGRKDDQVKINGFRVNLLEVENAVKNQIPGFNVAAAAVEKAKGLKAICIFIEGYQGDTGDIFLKLKKILPPYMLPESITPVETFPVTTSGKTDRKKLAAVFYKP